MEYLRANKTIIYYLLIIFIITAAFLAVPAKFSLAENDIIFLDIQTENVDGKTVKIKWLTDIKSSGKIFYGDGEENLRYYLIDSKEPSKYHETIIGNLKPKTTYYFQIIAFNESNYTYSFTRSFKTSEYYDKIPPQITNLKIPYVSGTRAFVSWETNEKATAKIEYGDNLNYEKSAGRSSLKTKHQIILKKLKPNTNYFLKIYSVDKDKNRSGYFYKELTTLSSDKTDKEKLIISRLRPAGQNDPHLSNDRITVSFSTNHYAKGKITLSRKKFKARTKNLEFGLKHQAVFADLEPESEYNLNIAMNDIFGKKTNIKNYKIKTISVPAPEAAPVFMINDEVVVKGAEFVYYTPAGALYKTPGSPRVYAILNGRRYHIPSPVSFNEYGYQWTDIKIIGWDELSLYPRVKLVKSPNSPIIYYLYQRPVGKRLKINLPSPAVFSSYPGNRWADVVAVAQYDIDNYQDARLIKTADSPAVYYLENNIKHFVSAAVFSRRGFNFSEVVEINQAHLDAYQTGPALN